MTRRATPADADAILHCLHTAFAPFRDAYSADAFADTTLTAETLAQRFTVMSIHVAEAGGEIIGTIAGSVEEHAADTGVITPSLEGFIRSAGTRAGFTRSARLKEGHIRGMAVLPEHRGKGVAPELLRAVEADLRQQGCSRITLHTTAPLQRAIRFYERNGYRASDRITDFYGMPLYEYVKEI